MPISNAEMKSALPENRSAFFGGNSYNPQQQQQQQQQSRL
jgi:hypothetical protein